MGPSEDGGSARWTQGVGVVAGRIPVGEGPETEGGSPSCPIFTPADVSVGPFMFHKKRGRGRESRLKRRSRADPRLKSDRQEAGLGDLAPARPSGQPL